MFFIKFASSYSQALSQHLILKQLFPRLILFFTPLNQTSANRAPDSRFVLEAIIKALMSKSNSSQVIKLMDRGRVT